MTTNAENAQPEHGSTEAIRRKGKGEVKGIQDKNVRPEHGIAEASSRKGKRGGKASLMKNAKNAQPDHGSAVAKSRNARG